jgi:hypothetical protein
MGVQHGTHAEALMLLEARRLQQMQNAAESLSLRMADVQELPPA